jgi:NADH-ubiquinone oxidoreductase chain 5
VFTDLFDIFVGYICRDIRIGLGTDFWGNAIFVLPIKQYLLESEWLHSSVKFLPLIFSFGGAFIALYQYTIAFSRLYQFKETTVGRALYTFLNRKWFFDKVYNEWVAAPLLWGAYTHTYQTVDRGILEIFGPYGFATAIYKLSFNVNLVSLGFIFRNLFILLGSLGFILILVGNWSQYLIWLEIPAFICIVLFMLF